MQNFRVLGASPPDRVPQVAGGFAPRPPNQPPPPMRISGYAPATNYINCKVDQMKLDYELQLTNTNL